MRCSFNYYSVQRLSRLLLLGLLLPSLLGSFGQTAELVPQPPVGTKYRRVFVPADSPETWPVDTERYLPVPQAEFLQLLEKTRLRDADHLKAPISISKAVHRAELKEGLLLGSSELMVQLPDQQTKLLSLAPLNLAVLDATWSRSPGQDATYGLWKGPDGKMRPGVLVDKSGTLQLEWQLSALREDEVRTAFELKLPVVVPQTLELSLPANHSASLATGQLLRTDQGTLGETLWTFQLAGSESHQLVISRPSAARTAHTMPLVSQVTSYQLKTPGLQVGTQFRLDARESGITELSAAVTPGLRIVDVTLDHREVAWRMENVGGKSRMVIERPASEYPQLLEVHGLARFTPEVAWELPRIRLLDVAWTEGTTSLLVSPKLRLRSLEPKLATLQHIVGIEENMSSGEVFRFQEWSEEASIEVMAGRRAPRLLVRSATTLDLGRDEATAGVMAHISNTGREQFQLQAEIAKGWAIESVVTTPQSALVEWHLDQQSGDRLLQLQLKRPISIEADLHIEIKTRRTAGKTILPATIGQLEIVRFLEADTAQQFLLLRARETQPLTLRDTVEKARLTSEDLTTAEAALLPESFAGTLLELSSLDKSEVLELRPETARYDAKVQIEVEVAKESIAHRYTLDCEPISGAVSELVIECDEPLPESLRWQLDGLQNALVPVQIRQGRRSADQPSRPLRYRMRLPNAKVGRFRLTANYSVPSQKKEECNLIRLPQANRWSGQVFLRGSLNGLQVVDQGWTPIIGRPTKTSERMPSLGCYRLGPEENRRTGTKRLTVRRKEEQSPAPEVVAWLAEYRTLQAANGAAIHMVNFSLENLGADAVEVTLPESAELQEAWVENRRLDLEEIGTLGATCRFRLSADQRWPSLVLKYSTHDSELVDSATLGPVVLSGSFPVNLSRWTIWAPEQYQIDNAIQHYRARQYPWWKRIFGPLARSDSQSIFNPVEAQDWKQLFSDPLAAQKTKQAAETLSRQLASQLQSGANAPWGELVSELLDQADPTPVVSIDRLALLAKGIEANTPSQKISDLGATRGTEAQRLPLSAYGLAILVSPRSIVLTSDDRVSHWRDQLHPTETPGVYQVDTDGLTYALEAAHTDRGSQVIDLPRWKQMSNSARVTWDSFPAAQLADVGRHIHTVEFLESEPTVVVRRTFVRRSLWYAILLLSLVLGVWQLAHYPNKMILIGAIAGATCLVVPIHWLTIPQAVFLGLLAAAIIRILIKSTTKVEPVSHDVGRLLRATVVILVSNACLYTSPLFAQPSSIPETGANSPVELPKVFVPIDAQGSHQGEDVYLPTSFLQRLQKLASAEDLDRPKWVLREAVYRGSLPDDLDNGAADNLQVQEPWTLLWKIESFTANCRLTLPLQQNDADWQADAHRLDGVPVTLDWMPKGNGCVVTLPETGVHWLKIVALPHVQLNDRVASVQLRIPPVPGAKLHVASAQSPINLQVASAEKDLSSEASEPQQFVLGDNQNLVVSWEPKIAKLDISSWDRLEQLSWLHVESSGTRLETQLIFEGLRSPPRVLELNISPQLKLTLPGEDSFIEEVVYPTSQHPTRLQLKLRQGLPEGVVIPLQFEFQRATTVGRLYFPKVRLVDHAPDQTLFAVSVAAGLSYDESIHSFLRSIEPQEFSSAWKDTENEPLYAYALGQGDPEWSLQVWPDTRTISAQQTLRVYCSPNEARVDFEAVLGSLKGNWLTHRIQVPTALEIDSVTVENRSDLSRVPVRWSRASKTEVVVFLGRPLSTPHLLRLRGSVDTPANNELTIPKVQLLNTDRSEIHLDLFRTDDVDVRWLDPELSLEKVPQAQVSQNSSEIPIGHLSWRSSESDSLAKLRIERNKPVFETTTLTTVDLGLAGWSTTLSTQLRIREGIVSRLSMNAPAGFLGPYVVEPAQVGVIDVVENTPEGRTLTLLLAQPAEAGDEVDVRLRGNLKLAANQRLVVPTLGWKGATQEDRYVLLPSMVNEQPMEWHKSGLRRAALPAQLESFARGDEPALAYHVEQNQFHAEERSFRGTMRNAMLRSAKVSSTLDQQGLMAASAELILQPGRATSCAIQLPVAAELIQLVIGDQAARRELRADGRWKVTLGPAFMPRRILVNYRVPLDLHSERLQLTPPLVFIGDQALPTPQTLWRIRPTAGLQLRSGLAGRSIDGSRFYEESYRHLAQTLQDSQTQVGELPEQEGNAWLEIWQKIVRRAEAAQQIYDRTETNETTSEFEQGESVGVMNYPPTVPLQLGDTLNGPERFYLSVPGSPLVLQVQAYSQQNLWQWFAAIALVCGTWAIVLQLRSKTTWHHELCRWPHSLALGGGLCWWLLLTPSAAGLLVIVLALTSVGIKQWRQSRGARQPKLDTQLTAPAS